MGMMMVDMLGQLLSTAGTIIVFWTMYQRLFPDQLHGQIRRYTQKVINYFSPYVDITFNEFDAEHGRWFDRSDAFAAIERYLEANSSLQAKRLKAKLVKDTEGLVFRMDDHEEITDVFKGVKVWWTSSQSRRMGQSITLYPREDEKRFFKLTFHKKHRDLIKNSYTKYVLEEGKAISVRERQRKLYTNNKSYERDYGFQRSSLWCHLKFEHPASFDTLALDPHKKQEIVDDLDTFSKSKEYYAKIGKAWKRGYLLYGPPGTGKSSMIAAMANFLKYDVYDVELTAVKDNTELRRLLIDTSSKSIVVIEDIDCSLDLTGQREKVKNKDDGEEKEKAKNAVEKEVKKREEEMKKKSEVTLSGLLNCIDGLWSCCGEERIFVFTTNFVEKLDEALIRRGRMDKHIEMSYCTFEAFKILAKNYLDQYDHELFPAISQLLEEVNMTPADVAENLMPKSANEDADTCFNKLIKALEKEKEAARLKADEEKKRKAEEEEEEKKRKEKSDEGEKKGGASNKDVKENGNAGVVSNNQV